MESYSCVEYINVENLNKMIKANKLDDEVIKVLKNLKTHVKNTGSHKVDFIIKEKHKRNKAIGRMYPKNKHPCLQGLKRNVRKALAYDTSLDLDIKNAHPVILNQILKQNDIQCDKLDYYVNHREDILNMYEDRDYGKERINSLINSGRPKEAPDFERLFYDDVMNATSKLFKLSKYEIYYKKGEVEKPTNAHGHAVSFLCQDYERKCISSVIEKLKELDYEPSTIIHDGLLVHTKEVLDKDIHDIEEYVKQQNHIEVELVVKPMNVFDETKLWDDKTTGDSDESNDTDEAKKFLEWMTELGHHFCRSKSTLFWYNHEIGIWKMGADNIDLRSYIINCPELDPSFSKSLRKQDCVIGVFKSLVPVDDNFTKGSNLTTYRKIPFNNGIYDFTSKKLIPFSKDYKFFSKMAWDYDTNIDEKLANEIVEKVIYGTLGQVRGDYYLDLLSRALAGEVDDKTFSVIIGSGNSGKGVNSDLFEAFGDFAGTFNAGQLCKKMNESDSAKAKSWMVAIASKRIVFCSEIPMGTPIDQGSIKTLASGGDPITGRQNFKDEMTFNLECSAFAFLNDIPEIKGSDDAIRNRMRYLETQYVYLSDEAYEERKSNPIVRKADDSVRKVFVKREDVLRTFAIMICNNYKPKRPVAPSEVLIESKEWLSSDDVIDKIRDLFEFTGKEDDIISSSQLNQLCKQAGIEASPTKIGKVMRGLGYPVVIKKQNGKTIRVFTGIKYHNPDRYETYDF